MHATIADIAEAWIRYGDLPDKERNESHPLHWAEAIMQDLPREDPEKAWAVMQRLWALASSDRMLALIAAGPLEDILVYHGAAFIDRIESRARKDPVLRKLLGAVWKNNMLEAVWERVRAAAGPSF